MLHCNHVACGEAEGQMDEARDEGPGGGETPAADAPDWDDLAKRYVDLWQQHITALSADPGLADQFARLMQGMVAHGAPGGANPLMANPLMAPMMGATFGAGGDGAATAWPPAAGNASGERERRVDELERRLADVEARLDRLAGADKDGD